MCTLHRGASADMKLGLHRDGSRWGLPDEDVAMRQRLFWEVSFLPVPVSWQSIQRMPCAY